jgi:hypothetical protein
MEDDLKKKELDKNILGLIPGERLISSSEKDRFFNQPQNIDQFNEAFVSQKYYFEIDPCIPDFKPRHKYIAKLKQAKQRLEQKKDEEVKQAIKIIEDKHSVLIMPIDHAISKLEAIIFLKDKCDMVIVEGGKAK